MIKPSSKFEGVSVIVLANAQLGILPSGGRRPY
jgi:hypothetical protein